MKQINLKIPLSEKGKQRFSKWLLDTVETWPKFRGGIIQELQTSRDFQRKMAEKTFDQTKPPENVSLNILGFRLFEVFFVEDFNNLEKNIYDIFEERSNDFHLDQIRIDFQKFKRSIGFSGYLNIGHICRPGGFVGTTVIRRMELPEGVDSIWVTLQKDFPSMMTLCFTVVLTPEVNETIQRIHREKYLPDYFIDAISLPLVYASSHSFSSEQAQKNEILKKLEKVRTDVERIIFTYFQGYFYRSITTKSKLPTIEIYSLKAEEKVYSNFKTFTEEYRFWFNSFDFQFFPLSFTNEYMLFYENYLIDTRQKEEPISAQFKIILFEEPAKKRWGVGAEATIASVIYSFHDLVAKITIPLTLLMVQKEEQNRVEIIREKAFQAFSKKKFLRNLKVSLNEYNQIQNILRTIERIKFDFDQVKNYLEREFKDDHDLLEFSPERSTREPRDFYTYTLSRIEKNNKVLFDHSAFLERHFSRYIEFKNIEAIYNLQVVTVILTVVAVFLGIVSALAGWEAIIKFVQIVSNFIQSSFIQ